jgi:hypothetical protein
MRIRVVNTCRGGRGKTKNISFLPAIYCRTTAVPELQVEMCKALREEMTNLLDIHVAVSASLKSEDSPSVLTLRFVINLEL